MNISFMYKWKTFACDLKRYLQDSQAGLDSPIGIEVGKHFSHRVADRFSEEDYSTIRRMLYHVINKDLCKILYWYTMCVSGFYCKDLKIIYNNFCIILNIGSKVENPDIVIRTIYKKNKHDDCDRFFTIDIKH